MYRYTRGKHSLASKRNFEKLQKSADCFWRLFQSMWGSDLVNLRWLLIPWWRILNAIMLRKLSESKTSYSRRPVSLFAIISTYPTAHKQLPKFQWQQRHFSLYKAKLSFLQSNNYCTAPHPTLKHEPNWTSAKKYSTSEECWADNLFLFSAKIRNSTNIAKAFKKCIDSQCYIWY